MLAAHLGVLALTLDRCEGPAVEDYLARGVGLRVEFFDAAHDGAVNDQVLAGEVHAAPVEAEALRRAQTCEELELNVVGDRRRVAVCQR